MQVNYFQAEQILKNKIFNYYIISGNEPFQKKNITDMITHNFQKKNFEIIKEYITLQNYIKLYDTHQTVDLFFKKRFFQITFLQGLDKNIERILLNIYQKLQNDTHYLFIFDHIKKDQQKAKWFQLILKKGLYIYLNSPTKRDVFKILKLSIKDKNIKITEDALMLIITKTEGNLSAANHIISLLSTYPKKTFESSNILNFLADFMRYNVFDLINSILQQETKRTLIIANHLFNNTEPVVVLWAIIKELRLWILLFSQTSNEQTITFKDKGIWASKRSNYLKLFKRFKLQDFKIFMNTCLNIDLMIKGVIDGNIKQSLIALIFEMSYSPFFIHPNKKNI